MRAAEITAVCERPNHASGLSSSPATTRRHEARQVCFVRTKRSSTKGFPQRSSQPVDCGRPEARPNACKKP
eukprot:6633078-Lingulodinium_polyedra.AAC.1